MKLQNYSLETAIDFDRSQIWTLSCDSPTFFEKLTGDFFRQTKGEPGQWTLWENKNLELSKYVCYVVDYHGVSFTDKKATTLLLEHLKQLAFDEKHTVATHEILAAVTKYFADLSFDIDYAVSVDEVGLNQLLKAVPISFLDEAETLYEKLMDYVVLLSRLTAVKVLVCVNLRCYLPEDKLVLFFKHCEQHDVKLLCMEHNVNKCLAEEVLLVVDNDLCEFFLRNEY